MEKDINKLNAIPIIKWVYGANDGKLNGKSGSALYDDPFPKPVSSDHKYNSEPKGHPSIGYQSLSA
jgi:hypothetical protein